MVRTLKSHPYAQAKVIYDGDGDFVLVSYSTPVVRIDDGIISVLGLYSATTRKHISAFMREFGLDYSIAKKCYEENIEYDMYSHQFM